MHSILLKEFEETDDGDNLYAFESWEGMINSAEKLINQENKGRKK